MLPSVGDFDYRNVSARVTVIFTASLVQWRTVLPPVRRHRWDTSRLKVATISRQFVTPSTWN